MKRAVEWVSSVFMESSRTLRNSVKVRVRVERVRWVDVLPNNVVTIVPNVVGTLVPVSASSMRSRAPRRERREWMFSNMTEGRVFEGWDERDESSRFAQSMTIRMESMSASTLAKKRVSSRERDFRDSESSSSSRTMIGALVMFVLRTDSPRSQTATPVSCRVPTCWTPFSE